MIKLFTLGNLSAVSSDAVYKICLALDDYGMSDENIFSFDGYGSLFDATVSSLDMGDYVIIAAEPQDYTDVKRYLSARLALNEISSPVLAEAISKNKSGEEFDFDMEEQCTVPSDCALHLSADGLYSGFTVRAGAGLCTLIPLDFSRIDPIIENYKKTFLNLPIVAEPTVDPEEEGYDFKESVSQMVYALIKEDERVALATGEATMWIYNLYDRIEGLSEAINFVDIIDTNRDEEKTSEELESEEAEDENSESPEEKESVSARTIRHAREAMRNMSAEYGAAISDIYTSEDESGEATFFAFVAVADSKTTKAKKITTANEEEARLLLPHCVTVLCETVCKKMEDKSNEQPENKSEEQKKFSKGMIAFAVAVLLVAIISPICIAHFILGGKTENQQTQPVIATGDVATTLSQTTLADTTAADPFGIGSSTVAGETALNQQNNLTAAEPTASEITVEQTSPTTSSTSGTFKFYVFGYGHGVGMSQYGANYLASLGWNYTQILANYYYGTTLVSGDTYPEKIKYNGTEYATRDFLAGVLEAEMGGGYHAEALKAQAVAAYTFAKYYKFDIDTSSMAYQTSPSQTCYDAVDAVMKNGIYISYNGATALTPFHAISAGVTSSYHNTWGGTEVLYLSGGRPSYGDYNAPEFKSTYEISSAAFKSLAESKNLGISLSGDPATWISIISHDNAISSDIGYVSSINVGGKVMTGNEFRSKVLDGNIRSHCFTVVYIPDSQ
ncbi:MAG: SpoIID/LytB domain-containing protein [Acutalibacteraceae bacterium]